ncbi:MULTISPECIES: DUF2790 domain-containing protein [Pseudomonas]|uniref:DUF2790 domain-containing protein n=1 Tax=Pseudomonas eucalypticola TaxID=2599595 RepID=A0A7D5H7Q2_9PSED|nr:MULTISPECIES: DUF2790 domain-containing protein [Pseudomonas]QKZ05144.1 DUF2790 domain-containing protein [Pseudomonas eucalypticola]
MRLTLTFAALALGFAAASAHAEPAQTYAYGQKLDIARVIDAGDIPDVCTVVPVTMVYEDSQGQRHSLVYRVMGKGCSN